MITINITEMFEYWEPWDCSNSVENLGPRAAELTWDCASEIADYYKAWLVTPLAEALYEIRRDARETGAWTREEIEAWTQEETLAYLVQCIASDLRLIGSDDNELEACVEACQDTDWDYESEYPRVYLYMGEGKVMGQWQ